MKNCLFASTIYLKRKYRNNVSFGSECADHCANFGLSEKLAQSSNIKCNHDHHRTCVECNLIDLLKKQFELEINILDVDDQEKLEFEERLNQSFNSIKEWKHHLIRCFCQESIKNKILDELQEGEALIIGDWAMKFNPLFYREKVFILFYLNAFLH